MAGVDDLASAIQQIAANPRNMVIRGFLSEAAQARIEAPHPAAGASVPPEAAAARGDLHGALNSFLARATAWHRAKAEYDAASG